MEKRKRDDGSAWFAKPPIIALLSGLVALCFLAVWGIFLLGRGMQPEVPPTALPSTSIPVPPSTAAFGAPQLTPNPSATSVSFTMPPDTLLVVSTTDNDILTSGDGIKFTPTGIKGADVAVSPRNGILAFWRTDTSNVHVYVKGKDFGLNSYGAHQIPTWSADGILLFLTSLSNDYGSVSRFRSEFLSENGAPSPYGSFFLMISPLVTTPSGDRTLVAQLLAEQRSKLYTMDVLCAAQTDCKQSSEPITTVPYVLTWVNYEPTRGDIVFSEQEGNIYLLDAQTKKVTPFVVDDKQKSRPIFSKDGSRLAYLDQNGSLHIMRVSDKSIQVVPDLKIASVSWVR
jgi:hypothetical protein